MEMLTQGFNSIYESTIKEDNFNGNGYILFIGWIVRALIYIFILPMWHRNQYKDLHNSLDKEKDSNKKKEILAKISIVETKYQKHNYSGWSIVSNMFSHAWELTLILHFITPMEYHPLWIIITILKIIQFVFYDIMTNVPNFISDISTERNSLLSKMHIGEPTNSPDYFKNELLNLLDKHSINS